MILLLDSKNRIVKDEVISIGTLNASIIHPREVFKSAIRENANSIILVHNHPSGDPEPSAEDEQITEKLFEAGELLVVCRFNNLTKLSATNFPFIRPLKRVCI